MKKIATVNKLHTKRIAVTVSIAAVLIACILVCSACGYIFVSVSSITASYHGNAVEVGGSIDEKDVTVTAKYSDNTSKAVSGFKLSYDFSNAGERVVTVTYSEMGKSVRTSFTVEVKEKTPEPPAVTLDNITAVYLGEAIETGGSLNNTDITVTAHYSDNSVKTITRFDVSGFNSESAGNKIVTVKYEEDGVTKTTTVMVVVKEPPITLQSIAAVYNGQPILVGGALSKENIEVTAHYSDGGNATVTDYTLSGFDSSSAGEKTVTVSYTENGATQNCNFQVTVSAPPATLESITAVYKGGNIKVGGTLNNDEITVTAFYSDESSMTVTRFSVGGFSSAKAGVCNVTVSYSDYGVTKECTLSITIDERQTEVADYGKYGILQQDGSVKVTNTAVVNDDLQIHFLAFENNSPGDSIYIKAGDTDILIDAGSTTTSANTIARYINKHVTDGKLEYVIATHSDTDHIYAFVGSSSAQGILDRYEIDTIITYPAYYNKGYLGEKSATQVEFENKCQDKAAQGTNLFTDVECYNNAKEGAQRVYKLSDNIEMEILYNAYYTTKGSNNNNYSVCLMLNQYGDGYDFDNPDNPNNKNNVNHFLFTGDLEGSGENMLVANNDLPEVVLFKGGHHGSATSSNIVLLEKINPKLVCVCTCCGDGRYGFPKQEFIDRVAMYTDMVFMTNQNVSGKSYTHLNGNIAVTSNANGVFVNCSNGNILFKDTDWFKQNRQCPTDWQETSN